MSFNKPLINKSNPYRSEGERTIPTRTIYYGEVLSINDPTDGGTIKVKIKDLDSRTSSVDELPNCFPLLPKYFYVLPKVGEIVRVFIEDMRYPQRNRYWLGSIISQPQKIGFDNKFSALSTTTHGITAPDKAPSTYPDAKGVFPENEDIAIVGRVNTDLILRTNEIQIRAGKHENDNILKFNRKNPAQINLNFELKEGDGDYTSSTTIFGDKIALISHSGNPKFKAAGLNTSDRERIFNEGHPLVRGDVLIQALELIRKAIITHIHPYSNMLVDKNAIIDELDKIDFNQLIQKNIVIN